MNSKKSKQTIVWTAKELARIAVFVGLTLAVQYVLSALPGVELVTLLFAVFSFVYGAWRGAISAVAFSLLRQCLFGFFPTVLFLYLVYYPLLAAAFGILGAWLSDWESNRKKTLLAIIIAILLACICTVLFTVLDNVLTPWLAAYTAKATELYWKASLPFLGAQLVCVSISVGVLFYPLVKALQALKKHG